MADYISQYTGGQIDNAVGRALPGGALEALIADKAPNGFSLGNVSMAVAPNYDANQIVGTGWFRASVNTPTGSWWCVKNEMVGTANNDAFQVAWCINDKTYFGCVVERHKYGGTWGPWKWRNPPMLLGVEYLTTEYYLGKPVYTQLVTCGALADTAESLAYVKDANGNNYTSSSQISIIETIAHATDRADGNGGYSLSVPFVTGATLVPIICVRVAGINISFRTSNGDFTGYYGFARLKYIK